MNTSESTAENGGIGSALLLIAAGILLLLHQMDRLPLGELVRDYWPVILIVFGIEELWKGFRRQTAPDRGGVS